MATAPTAAQKTALTNANNDVNSKTATFQTAYNNAKSGNGLVVILAGTTLHTAWVNMQNARKTRNDLLATYRSQGVKV